MSKVSDIKRHLSAMGYYSTCDFSNKIDEDFENAVRYFQSENYDEKGNKLSVDGICGPLTKWSILYSADVEAMKFWSIRKDILLRQVEMYLKLKTRDWKKTKAVKSGKDFFTLKTDEEFLVYDSEFEFKPFQLVDGLYMLIKDKQPPSEYSRSYLRSFTGSGVLAKVDGGVISIVGSPFIAASHPGQQTTTAKGTPDVNKDGSPDIVWLIPDTIYRFKGKRSGSNKRFNPSDSYTPANRDYQSKGFIDKDEAKRVFPATATQYHDDAGVGRPVSVGCLTSPLKDYNRVAKWIEDLDVKQFYGLFRYFQ